MSLGKVSLDQGQPPVIIGEHPKKGWKITALVCGILLALSAAAVLGLYFTRGIDLYFYGAAGAGMLALIPLVISLVKMCNSTSSVERPADVIVKPAAPETPVKLAAPEAPMGDACQIDTVELECPKFDFAAFMTWVTEKTVQPQKKALLEATIGESSLKSLTSVSRTYTQLKLVNDDHLSSPLSPINVATSEKWFTYEEASHTNVDFAAEDIGGGWRAQGNVQEERMFCEIPELALMAYLAAKTKTPLQPFDRISGRHQPFLVTHVEREWEISTEIYARQMYDKEPEEIADFVKSAPKGPKINIVAIVAKHWDKNSLEHYSEADLRFHLEAAYLACRAEKLANPSDSLLITGAWGCGAFNNSEMMMTAIQMLAGRMTGVNLKFAGVGNPFNPGYTADNLDKIKNWIDSCETATEALQQMLQAQTAPLIDGTDPKEWRPKNKSR